MKEKIFEFPLLCFRVSERKFCVGNTCFEVISSVSDFLNTNSIILTQNSFSKAIKSKLGALVADNTANVTAFYVIITLKMSVSLGGMVKVGSQKLNFMSFFKNTHIQQVQFQISVQNHR